jgi:hypothetical protein
MIRKVNLEAIDASLHNGAKVRFAAVIHDQIFCEIHLQSSNFSSNLKIYQNIATAKRQDTVRQ